MSKKILKLWGKGQFRINDFETIAYASARNYSLCYLPSNGILYMPSGSVIIIDFDPGNGGFLL